jgi:hypothetical protein
MQNHKGTNSEKKAQENNLLDATSIRINQMLQKCEKIGRKMNC